MRSMKPVNTTVLDTTGIPSGTTLKTPEGMPDIIVKAISPIKRTLLRVARVYVQSLVGMLTVVMGNVAPGVLTPPDDFIGKLVMAAGLALAPSVVALISNLSEWLMKMDPQSA